MKNPMTIAVTVVLSIWLYSIPSLAQEAEQEEHEQREEHAEAAEHEERGESSDHDGRPHHMNDFAVFLGGTDEHGHPTEFTWGLDYKRRVAERWPSVGSSITRAAVCETRS